MFFVRTLVLLLESKRRLIEAKCTCHFFGGGFACMALTVGFRGLGSLGID